MANTIAKPAAVASLACMLVAATAGAWELGGGGSVWQVDPGTGAIASGATADGFQAVGACADGYALLHADRVLESTEASDSATSGDATALPLRLVVRCENRPLGLSVVKTYRVDERTGWLLKETAIAGPGVEKGFVHMLSHVRAATAMWSGGFLHHPVWGGGHHPLVRTAEVTEARHLRTSDGTGLMCLSNPGRDLTLGHVRLASNGQPVFFDYCAQFSAGSQGDHLTSRQTDTVALPTQWTMSCMHGPVGGGVVEPVSVRMGYALGPGDFHDFQLRYAALGEVSDLLHHEAASSPPWVRDLMIDSWTDYTVDHATTGTSWGRVLERMWFGQVHLVVFGYYENSYAYPGDDEQWQGSYTTVRDSPALRESLRKRHGSAEPFIVREDPGGLLVVRNYWKPSQQREALRAIEAACGHADRLKLSVYTHMGAWGQDRESELVKNHPELVLRGPSGEPYRRRTDYNMDDADPVAVDLQPASEVFQDWWAGVLDRQFEFFRTQVTYFDVLARGSPAVDWGAHRAGQTEECYPLYRRFVDIARRHGAAVFINYAPALFSDIGYSEFDAYAVYRTDWRAYATRLSGQQTLNRRGRPLFPVNTPHSLPDSFPPTSLADPTVPFMLHSPLLHNVRLCLHAARAPDPPRQADFVIRALPWVQAAFELRQRSYAGTPVRPRWWADECEVEAHAYNLDRSTAVVAFLNHGSEPLSQKVTVLTAPLGLARAKPVWVWRVALPHPFEAEQAAATDVAPIPRLARQSLAAWHEKVPDLLEYEEAWPADVPVLLVLAQCPALVESVDGRTCQMFLPEAYGTRIEGVRDGRAGRANLRVTSSHEAAAILVPLESGRSAAEARLRRLDQMHAAGVLDYADAVPCEAVEISGQRFARIVVPKGMLEVVVD